MTVCCWLAATGWLPLIGCRWLAATSSASLLPCNSCCPLDMRIRGFWLLPAVCINRATWLSLICCVPLPQAEVEALKTAAAREKHSREAQQKKCGELEASLRRWEKVGGGRVGRLPWSCSC